jgi:hypothetical protein
MVKPELYVKMGVITLALVALGTIATTAVQAQELLNTATNKIEFVQNMAERDVLEEIMVGLDQQAYETQSTMIVKQPDSSVTLFTID